mgnify:CR=1 FL=1
MAISTIQEVIDRSQVSIYLSGNDNAKGTLFSPRRAAPGSPISIALISDVLNWGYDGGAQTDADIRQMANYLEWLIGQYGREAQYILTGAGGGAVIPGGGSVPSQLNFTVAASGTTLIDGQSTVTLTQFIGYNLLVNKNGQSLNQITTAPVYYTWNNVTGVLTVVPAAFLGDEFQITPA